MARFVWGHTACSEVNQPRVRRVRFGDGYEQRMPDGLNHKLREWQLGFARSPVEVGHAINKFLRDRAATESFEWTNNADEDVLVVCDRWQVRDVRERGIRFVYIDATFREVVA